MSPTSPPVFWRRTPPAVFPPLLGLFGLTLAWRRAVSVFYVHPGWSEIILGATTLIFLFFAIAYLAKFIRRPGVVIEDLRILPGRAGLAALPMSVIVLAAGLVPIFPRVAAFVLFVGLGLHLSLAGLVIYVLLTGPQEQRQITPAWHLSFVGFIVVPLAAVPLGLTELAAYVLAGSIAMAALVYGVSLGQLARRNPPPPLRPLLAIHLAPISLCGSAAQMLGLHAAALVFAALASLVLLILMFKVRYLTAAGFSPFWGAFTFPMAAWCGLMLALASGGGEVFRIAGGVGLIACTLIIPAIAAKVLRLWVKGTLALKTNAAVA